ncbi:SMI1/KNR4 family protein [Saccharopolyspora indica]|uniref:SMI1/KNR4 family protein n=1 Tax=Saccharopolyspora indica TaxID=1229659 RepID=UPI002FDC054D
MQFDQVIRGAAATPAELAAVRAALAERLGLPEPFVLPPGLAELLSSGVQACIRETEDDHVEFGWLGADSAAYYDDYQFAAYMPGAVPIALDGGGGFYVLDVRGGRNDGDHPVVWSHAGSLGWDVDDHRPVAPDFASLLANPHVV